MPESYPLPSHAASFWLSGDDLMIAFPPTGAEQRGHTVRLPTSVAGLQLALSVLRDRTANGGKALGEPGTPSQYQLERALVHDKKYSSILKSLEQAKALDVEAKKASQAALAKLGLVRKR